MDIRWMIGNEEVTTEEKDAAVDWLNAIEKELAHWVRIAGKRLNTIKELRAEIRRLQDENAWLRANDEDHQP